MPVGDKICKTCDNTVCHCRKCHGKPNLIKPSCGGCGYTRPHIECSGYRPKCKDVLLAPTKGVEITVDENVANW